MLCLFHVISELVPELNYVQSSLANVKKKPKKQKTRFPIFYLLTFGWVFKKIHSTLDFFLLIMLNVYLFVFACLFTFFFGCTILHVGS